MSVNGKATDVVDEIALTLQTAGVSQLEKECALMHVEEALRNLARLLEDSDNIRLATLREAAIKKLDDIGISASARLIDAAIPRRANDEDNRAGKALTLREIERCMSTVDSEQLLIDLCRAIRRYIVADNADIIAIALWVVHGHAIDAFAISPFLNASSPEKGCGKTTLFAVLFFLLPRPLLSASVSPASIFRAIELYKPSFLIDEADTFQNLNEELRGLLNASHLRASAQVIRVVGDEHEPRAFSTWCPKAIALIGRLPDTLDDRSIVINMRRKKRSETSERFSAIDPHPELEELASRIAAWAHDNFDALRHARPAAEGIDLRLYDNWMPLLAVADAAGDQWARWARIAASTFVEKASDQISIKVELLTDVAQIMGDEDRMSSEAIVEALNAMPDRPWPTLRRGKPLTQLQLARMLRAFEIKPEKYRDGVKTVRGYERSDIVSSLSRYNSANDPEHPEQKKLASQINELEAIFVPDQPGTGKESISREPEQIKIPDPWDGAGGA
jgi:hypothetical protein